VTTYNQSNIKSHTEKLHNQNLVKMKHQYQQILIWQQMDGNTCQELALHSQKHTNKFFDHKITSTIYHILIILFDVFININLPRVSNKKWTRGVIKSH